MPCDLVAGGMLHASPLGSTLLPEHTQVHESCDRHRSVRFEDHHGHTQEKHARLVPTRSSCRSEGLRRTVSGWHQARRTSLLARPGGREPRPGQAEKGEETRPGADEPRPGQADNATPGQAGRPGKSRRRADLVRWWTSQHQARRRRRRDLARDGRVQATEACGSAAQTAA